MSNFNDISAPLFENEDQSDVPALENVSEFSRSRAALSSNFHRVEPTTTSSNNLPVSVDNVRELIVELLTHINSLREDFYRKFDSMEARLASLEHAKFAPRNLNSIDKQTPNYYSSNSKRRNYNKKNDSLLMVDAPETNRIGRSFYNTKELQDRFSSSSDSSNNSRNRVKDKVNHNNQYV